MGNRALEKIYYADGKTVHKTVDRNKSNYKYITEYAQDGTTKLNSSRYHTNKYSEKFLQQQITYYSDGSTIYESRDFEEKNIKKFTRFYKSSVNITIEFTVSKEYIVRISGYPISATCIVYDELGNIVLEKMYKDEENEQEIHRKLKLELNNLQIKTTSSIIIPSKKLEQVNNPPPYVPQ